MVGVIGNRMLVLLQNPLDNVVFGKVQVETKLLELEKLVYRDITDVTGEYVEYFWSPVKPKEEYTETEINAMRNHCENRGEMFRPLSKEEWKKVNRF